MILLFAAALFLSCGAKQQTSEARPSLSIYPASEIEQIEYDLLSYVISGEYVLPPGPKSEIEAATGIDEVSRDSIKLVIETITNGNLDSVDSLRERTFEYLRENDITIDRETFDDFVKKNLKNYRLERKFNFRFGYGLYTPDYDEDWTWEEFYQKFPRFVGTTCVSRVGLNNDRTDALLYIGRQQDWLSGTGVIYHLVKKSGQWVIRSRILQWIS